MHKLYGLQYLRAVAAMSVVCFHAIGRSGGSFTVGQAGVDLFFALSGFLMTVITAEGASRGRFLADRVRRIVPAYWIATTAILAGALAGLFPHMVLAPAHVVASYLFVPAYMPGSGGQIWPLLVPGWTLNYEMIFYLLFTLVLPLRPAVRAAAVTLVLGAAVATRPWLRPLGVAGDFYSSPILLEFAAGTWLGIAWIRPGRWPGMAAGWAAIAAGLAALAWVGWRDVDGDRVLIFGVPALLLLAGTLCLERQGGVRDWAWLRAIGDASYSIYLWQTVAIGLALRAAAHGGLGGAGSAVLGIVAATAMGIAAFRAIERPILVAFRARRSRSAPEPAGAQSAGSTPAAVSSARTSA